MSTKNPNPNTEIDPAKFPSLRSFLRGYFHEDVVDEYGTPFEAAEQFCDDAETDERNAVAREWQQVAELTHSQPAGLNAALKKLGSACQLNEEEITQVSGTFARCLAPKSHRRVVNDESE